MKQRSFIMKYQRCYSNFNCGKSSRARKRNRRMGEKIIRQSFNKQLLKELNDYLNRSSENFVS